MRPTAEGPTARGLNGWARIFVVRVEVVGVSYLVEFQVADSESVIVEMDDQQLAGLVPAAVSPGEVAAQATQSFEAAVDKLLPAVRAIGDRMRKLAPDELEVSLGVKLTAEAGVIVAKAAGEANFTVTLRWSGGSSQ